MDSDMYPEVRVRRAAYASAPQSYDNGDLPEFELVSERSEDQ